jgi:hypothetical protein
MEDPHTAETVHLSKNALSVLRLRLAGERVEVTEVALPVYRELVAIGQMEPLHSFARGNDGAYHLTEAACDMLDEVMPRASRVPSA